MSNGIFKLRDQILGLVQKAWTGSQKTPAVEYLVVAGGGSGNYTGGGGAGGLLQGVVNVPSGTALTVTVGNGGTGGAGTGNTGNSGGNSVFYNITANGGGVGVFNYTAFNSTSGSNGGSGGGGASVDVTSSSESPNTPGLGIIGQGHSGGTGICNTGSSLYLGGGGGGAGASGLAGIQNHQPGDGGSGVASAISGTVTTYAGGGGGGAIYFTGVGASGGVGGGGAGGTGSGNGTNGTVNTGGGGGSSSYNGSFANSGNGGSGIVIISYPDIYAAAVSTAGTPTVSTSGSGSISFNGSSQYLSISTNSVFAFGTGDFTLEAFIYTNSSSSQYIISLNKGAGPECSMYLSSGILTYYDPTAGNKSSGVTPSLNAWHHVAVCRASGVIYFYVDGVQSGSTFSVTTSIANTSDSYFGGSSGGADFSGYATNFRVVKGVAVYTGSFTALTSPLTATQKSGTNISAITGTQTSVLLNTVSGSVFADSSTNSFAPATFGSPSWNQLSPFATGLGYKNRVYTWTGNGSITF